MHTMHLLVSRSNFTMPLNLTSKKLVFGSPLTFCFNILLRFNQINDTSLGVHKLWMQREFDLLTNPSWYVEHVKSINFLTINNWTKLKWI